MEESYSKDYIKRTEKLLTTIVAISYKISTKIPLSKNDLEQIEHITKCANLYKELNKNKCDDDVGKEESVKNDNVKNDNKYLVTDTNISDITNHSLPDTVSNKCTDIVVSDIADTSTEVDPFFDFSMFVDENRNIINFPKEDDKKEDEITYENDPELIEICNANKIKFDELIKQNIIKLDNIQNSFWGTIDVK